MGEDSNDKITGSLPKNKNEAKFGIKSSFTNLYCQLTTKSGMFINMCKRKIVKD